MQLDLAGVSRPPPSSLAVSKVRGSTTSRAAGPSSASTPPVRRWSKAVRRAIRPPLPRTREIAEICRRAWRRGTLAYAGTWYTLRLPPDLGTGLGKGDQAAHLGRSGQMRRSTLQHWVRRTLSWPLSSRTAGRQSSTFPRRHKRRGARRSRAVRPSARASSARSGSRSTRDWNTSAKTLARPSPYWPAAWGLAIRISTPTCCAATVGRPKAAASRSCI
jgi:hypothetical protein